MPAVDMVVFSNPRRSRVDIVQAVGRAMRKPRDGTKTLGYVVVPVLLAGLAGVTIGTLSGFYGGRLDNVLMRCLDVIFAFPAILLALAIVATLGPSISNAMLAITIGINLIFVPETRTTFWAAIPLLVPLIALASGLAVAFAYITVVYRDVEHLMITVFLPWFFITPIFYTLDQLPGLEGNEWVADLIYYVNFVTPFVEAIRDPIFFGERPDLGDVVYCLVAGVVSLMLGVLAARRMDDQVSATL